MMPRELFLLSDVPGDVALAVATAFAGTFAVGIATLWRQHVKDIAQIQANTERQAESAHASADAIGELTRAIRGNHDAQRSA